MEIVRMTFGSHVYGTDTPQSDRDEKGVFQDCLDNIVLGKTKDSINYSTGDNSSKNSSDDLDLEYKELRKFIKDALAGQTYALDMLFTPDEFIISTSDIWKDIVRNRSKFLSNNMTPFVGYCRQQAGKYGLKGSRLGDLIAVIEALKGMHGKSLLEVFLFSFEMFFNQLEHVNIVTGVNKNKPEEVFLDVLGKKFSENTTIENVLEPLEKMYNEYGHRATLAMQNKGVDWKAISHAYRCMYQLKKLKTSGEITFPLKESVYLLCIKLGKVDYCIVQDELHDLMVEVVDMESNLPEKPDYEFWEKKILYYYLNK